MTWFIYNGQVSDQLPQFVLLVAKENPKIVIPPSTKPSNSIISQVQTLITTELTEVMARLGMLEKGAGGLTGPTLLKHWENLRTTPFPIRYPPSGP